MNKEKQKLVLTDINKQKAQIEKAKEELPVEKIKVIENKLLEDSACIVANSLAFADIEFDDKGEVVEYPEEWDKLPSRELEKRKRIAKANWMTSADVPHGIKLAQQVTLGILKARSKENEEKKVLNIGTAYFTSPTATKDIEEDYIDVEE